jgi:hypothetical protein
MASLTPAIEHYRVARVASVDDVDAPPEIRERFAGRLFTLHDLEQRGVRIAGATAWYLASGRDWRLTLELASAR